MPGSHRTQKTPWSVDRIIEGLKPIPASEVARNDRKRTVPEPNHGETTIRRGTTDYGRPQKYGEWERQVHPDGAPYFYDAKRRIYTDADLSVPSERATIDHYAGRLLEKKTEFPEFPWDTCELVLEKSYGQNDCGYYFVEPGNVEPGKRCIFWLDDVSIGLVARHLKKVESMDHIKYIMEAEYWTHCMLFPNRWSITLEVVIELKKMVFHAISDNVASTTSVIPFDQEELKQILDLIDALKDGTEELFPHANCVVARFMHDFASAKFFNFCGQPWARLNCDQSVLSNGKYHPSFVTRVLSLGLFWSSLCDYAKKLEETWIDKILNRIMWKRFIADLVDDWGNLAITATVILNANIAFLALADVNAVARCFSSVSTVASAGAVFIGLVLIRQCRRLDSAEHGDKLFGRISKTVMLAMIFSLPYVLLLWSMILFIIAFAWMVFSLTLATKWVFGLAFAFVVMVAAGTAWVTNLQC